MNENRFQVFYTSDMGYLIPTFVSIASLFNHVSDKRGVEIHVLDCGISDGVWNDFAGGVSNLFPDVLPMVRHKVDMDLFSTCQPYAGSRATYARILPSSFSGEHWCLFSDGDVLFVDDVLKMKSLTDDSKIIIGHNDYDEEYLFEQWSMRKSKWYAENRLEWDPKQFVCMGFVLMNLDRMRKENFIARCLEGFSRFTSSPTADQEALNSVCKGQLGVLPEEWGKFNLCLNKQDFRPSAIHYTYSKPWKIGCGWTRALPDSDKLWILYAQKVANLKWGDFSQRNYFIYLQKRFYTEVYRVFLSLVGNMSNTPRFKEIRRMLSCRRVWNRVKPDNIY